MNRTSILPHRTPVRAVASFLAALAVAALTACATTGGSGTPVQQLRALIDAGDLAAADALIARRPADLDARRALDLSIRGGQADAVRHYAARAGVDAELDPDATTPLIRAVLDAPPQAREAVVGLLVESGARPDLVDRYGRDALTYAALRNRNELVALLDGSAGRLPAHRLPAFAAWLGSASGAAAKSSGVPVPMSSFSQVASVSPVPRGGPSPSTAAGATRAGAVRDPSTPAGTPSAAPSRRATGAQNAAASTRAPIAAEADVVVPVTDALLLRRSPWRPAAATDPGADVASIRFHGDGTADLLRHRPGTDRDEPMARSFVAWSIDAGLLRIAIVGDAFSATCVGSAVAPPPASGAKRTARPAGSASESDALALVCTDQQPTLAARRAGFSLDLARALLADSRAEGDADPGRPRPPSIVAIASGRVGQTDDAAPPPVARLAVSLRGASTGATCRPGKGRPRSAAPMSRTFGDWYVLDARRFTADSPLSGQVCMQTVARDAAMKACVDGGGDATRCRSVGGCPVGQASALAALPGVDAGWVACDADPPTARRKALAACRADLGCDCQLVALSGSNVNTQSIGATCATTPPTRRRVSAGADASAPARRP